MMGVIREGEVNRLILIAVIITGFAVIASGFDDFGYADYSGDGFTIQIPTEYYIEVEQSESGTVVTRFYWNDAYMRDFRVAVLKQESEGTLAELMFVNEEMLNAENELSPNDVIIGDKRLNKIGADEGYQGKYTVEEIAREYFDRSTLYLGNGDEKYLLDVSVHTGKLEGGLDIVMRILDSFRLTE
ncbi:MAG: hypothetical protein GY771_15960 [bacterium]|nr:hypothetical protein [bacterium]